MGDKSLRLFIFEYCLAEQEGNHWILCGNHRALIQADDEEEADQIFLKQIDGSKYRLEDPNYSWWEIDCSKGMTTIV